MYGTFDTDIGTCLYSYAVQHINLVLFELGSDGQCLLNKITNYLINYVLFLLASICNRLEVEVFSFLV